MGDYYTNNNNESLSHSQIVHELLKKISVELGTKEFRGGYQKPVFNGGATFMDYITDSRAEYIQAVETLSDILLPQYDDEMKKNYKEYESKLKKLNDGVKDEDIIMGDESHKKLIKQKLELVRELFRNLNLLLKRTNYLKAAAYSEEDIGEELLD